MTLYDGIRKNNFLVIGRVGIDFFPDPPGTKTEEATLMSVGMGGSSANIAAGIVKLGGKATLVTSVSDDSIGRMQTIVTLVTRFSVVRLFIRAREAFNKNPAVLLKWHLNRTTREVKSSQVLTLQCCNKCQQTRVRVAACSIQRSANRERTDLRGSQI